ncbi:MAG: HipA domain-containing protein [Clostridia bacterium]|nr:HipA domain-containing protein [Clostridia bacterium]
MGKNIYVYETWSEAQPLLMGRMSAEWSGRREVFSFDYDEAWLSGHVGRCFLDPALRLYQGGQTAQMSRRQIGLFTDSCPDHWGRMLMNRHELIVADREGRKPRKLLESDWLLGVCDEVRMGALRFSLAPGGPFLADDPSNAVPPWTALRELEAASRAFERDEDHLNERWLRQLLAPGAALGGARPKAAVKGPDGSVWIAKFPSKHDRWDAGAWEMVTHILAAACDLHVPEARCERCSYDGATYLTKRFDRKGERRIHFASAMALLGRNMDDETSSYLELADFIRAHGARPGEDLPELWKRIVFSMAVSNTDDHLKNHGFLLEEDGWRLSPMYDVNPDPGGQMLSMNVSLYDARIDMDLAIEVAPFFGLEDAGEARQTALRILKQVKQLWRPAADRCGIPRDAQKVMAHAFRAAESWT